MKLFLQISVFLFSVFAFSQDVFEPGFYIDNHGNQINGYINNEDWLNSPNSFLFKKSIDGSPEKLDMVNVRSFEINKAIKYEKHTVQVDSKPISTYKEESSLNHEPLFSTKTIFLKVLVEGEASLLQYVNSGNVYYYLKNADQIQPLVYKNYVDNDGRQRENTSFRKVLFDNVNCNNQDIAQFLKIKYRKEELIKLFQEYNECRNASFKTYKELIDRKSKLSLTVFIAYGFSTYKVSPNFEDESVSKPFFGGELSFKLPYNNYRYEVFSRLSYENLDIVNNSKPLSTGNSSSYFTDSVKWDVNYISLLFGTRYNFHLTESKNKIFIDAAVGVKFVSGDVIYNRNRHVPTGTEAVIEKDLKVKSPFVFNVGAGYLINSRIGIDVRYDFINLGNLEGNSLGIESRNNVLSASLRYTFLN